MMKKKLSLTVALALAGAVALPVGALPLKRVAVVNYPE